MKTKIALLAALSFIVFSLTARASLVAHWPGDGNSLDTTGTNNAAGTNITYVSGTLDQAFAFDGTGQLSIAPSAFAVGTSDFSIAFWINMTAQSGAIADLCAESGLSCDVTADGRISFSIADTNGFSCNATSVRHINDGTFHHVIVERHATDSMIYVDGGLSALSSADGIVNLTATDVVVTDPDSAITTTNLATATFGGNSCGDGLVGVVDDIRIYNTALDANEAYLLIHPDSKLAIVTQPFNQRTLANHSVVFNVVGVGIEPITYQWQVNGMDVPGAVSHVLTIPSAQLSDAGTYTAIVSNPFSNLTSTAATLYVTNGPTLDQYLVSRWSAEGTTLDNIKGRTAPSANLSYGPGVLGTAFRFDTSTSVDCGNVFGPLGYGDFTFEFWVKTAYSGYAEAIMAQRTICNVAPMFELQWDATRHFVSWQFGGQPGTLIFASSAGIPVTLNDGVFHHVAAVRKANAITLFIDGIRGPTSAGPAADLGTLPPNLILGHSACDWDTQEPFTGMLDEIALYNRAFSDAELFSTYQPNPSLLIVTQPKSAQAIEGSPVSLSVAVTGQQPYFYQWQFQGSDVSGATDSAYTIPSVPLSAAGDYSVKVSNTAENVSSASAHLAVIANSTVLPGLVSKWSAEGNGVDLLGLANLSCLNASFAPGVVGQAFSFDGRGDFISFNNCGDFGSNDFTIDFWERAASAGYSVLLSRPACYRVMDLGNDVSFELHTDFGDFSVQTSGQHIGDGQYHHIGCVRQDTNLLIYVDGVVAGTNSFPAIGSVLTSIFGFEIADDDGGPTRFGGQFDELELYSRALSASEIAGIYASAFNSPRATGSPQYINTLVGSPVTLTLPPISGEGPFTYQWQLNGVDIPDQTGPTFSNTVSLDGAGVYTCIVTGPDGATTIPVATISIQLAAGTYNGLFYFDGAPDDDTSGYITLTVTENQTFTGSIRQHGPARPFTGKFHANRSVVVMSGGTSISMVAESNGTEARLKGIVRKNGKNIPLQANRAVYSASSPTPQAGSYTLCLQGENSATAPNGDGFGNVGIKPNGSVTLGVNMADAASTSTQGVGLAKSGTWPLYCQLYQGRGSVLGWVSFTNTPGARCVGNLRWIKSAKAGGTTYRKGFAAKVPVIGSAFTPQSQGLGVNVNGGAMVFSGAKLAADVVNPIVGTNKNTIVFKTGSSTSKLTVNAKLGQFSATISQNGTPVKIKGVTMQDQSVATGYFIRNGLSGRVAIGH